jgi:hypothetical protein
MNRIVNALIHDAAPQDENNKEVVEQEVGQTTPDEKRVKVACLGQKYPQSRRWRIRLRTTLEKQSRNRPKKNKVPTSDITSSAVHLVFSAMRLPHILGTRYTLRKMRFGIHMYWKGFCAL